MNDYMSWVSQARLPLARERVRQVSLEELKGLLVTADGQGETVKLAALEELVERVRGEMRQELATGREKE